MQCSNHLKQIGIALHNHHDTHSNFPAARSYIGTATSGNASHWGDQLALCPFNEQTTLYSIIETRRRSQSGELNVSAVTEASGARIPTLLCPSCPQSRTTWTTNGFVVTFSNIVSCRGDVVRRQEWQSDWNENLPAGDAAARADARNGYRRGGFGPLVWNTFASISDGTSNTIAYSEAAISMAESGESTDNRVRGGFSASGTPALDANNPSTCLQRRNTSNPNTLSGETRGGRGRRMLYGLYYHSGFVTVLPPNSPSCSVNTDVAANGWSIHSANSYHTGGVNVALFDGSVRFVTDAVDAGAATRAQNLTGESPYGVWGAYGSIAAGESRTL